MILRKASAIWRSEIVGLTIWACAIYGLTFAFTILVIDPLQARIIENSTGFVSLIFLPHGLRVVMTWLYGWRAILPLFVAQFSVGYTLFEPAPLELTQYIAGAFVGATAAYIGCELMRRTGRDVYAYTGARLNWREFIFIGFIASIFNALGNVFVYEGFIAPKNILSTISGYLIGDTLGVAVALVLSMYVVRLVRLYKMNRPA